MNCQHEEQYSGTATALYFFIEMKKYCLWKIGT